MGNLKRVTITNACIMCGICEDEKYTSIFESQKDGTTIAVSNNGLVDIDKFPQIVEAQSLCPTQAILIEDDRVSYGTIEEAQDKLTQKIYTELRDYRFTPPDPREYEYESGVYEIPRIPAQYRSECKYRTYDSAEDAGIKAFKAAVWSQAKSLIRQYIVLYRVKQLKRYYTYEESENNFYYKQNKEIEKKLSEVITLAKYVTDGKIKFPSDFEKFQVIPDWKTHHFYQESLSQLENINWNFENPIVDTYRSWVTVDDYGGDKYYYDFSEAEEEFRHDIDRALANLLDREVRSRVESVVSLYRQEAEVLLAKKVDYIQKELKKYIKINSDKQFDDEIKKLCIEINKYNFPQIPIPKNDMDLNYDDSYRFYSKRDCEKAASNRRERAYNEGRRFLENLPKSLNENCLNLIGEAITQWKRDIIRIFDICGRKIPTAPLKIKIGESVLSVDLSNLDNVSVTNDDSIAKYVLREILHYGTSVGDVEYISQYSPEINVWEDYDIKETIFGNIKEVNHRYGYTVSIHEFDFSSYNVSKACTDALNQSEYWIQFTQAIKQSVIDSVFTALH